MKLYHHKTDGGAEYLMDTFVVCPNGEKEGVLEGATYVVRIDGDITKDAELSVKEKEKILLRIKWSISRGRNTYGYAICSLYANGKKETSTNGGGYDMQGTVLAKYIKRYYLPRLLKLTGNHGSEDDGTGFYGLMFYDANTGERSKTYKEGYGVSLDGACGWSSIVRIAKEIGLKLTRLENRHYLLEDTLNS